MKFLVAIALGVACVFAQMTRPTGQPQSPCPAHAIYDQQTDKCYVFDDRQTAWQSAEHECINFGGHLASVHSTAEANFIDNVMQRHHDGVYWGGLNELNSTAYVWSDGSAVDFNNWANNTNCQHGAQPCVSIDARAGQWYNCWQCSHQLPFACIVPKTSSVENRLNLAL